MIKTITIVAGARPNFMKIAPIIGAIKQHNLKQPTFAVRLVHTGQHYDQSMSETFFKELDIPRPDVNLQCGGRSHAEQTASIMVEFEKELQANRPDLVVVVGDVTSTMAAAIVSKKLNVRVAHVEAGIRSFDLRMPEEINRIVTDSISDLFFTTSEVANRNLCRSGVDNDRIFFVGNVMIDTLLAHRHRFYKPKIFDDLKLRVREYFVVTLHRPSNVDDPNKLKNLLQELITYSRNLPVIFPLHPRTAKVFSQLQIHAPNLFAIAPLGYLSFNYLVENALAVITDSGGITEETTVMGIPCLTLRDSTERPETVTHGTNELIGCDLSRLRAAFSRIFAGDWKKGLIPEKWDGRASQRIVAHLASLE